MHYEYFEPRPGYEAVRPCEAVPRRTVARYDPAGNALGLKLEEGAWALGRQGDKEMGEAEWAGPFYVDPWKSCEQTVARVQLGPVEGHAERLDGELLDKLKGREEPVSTEVGAMAIGARLADIIKAINNG
jgi:hypothetical protein